MGKGLSLSSTRKWESWATSGPGQKLLRGCATRLTGVMDDKLQFRWEDLVCLRHLDFPTDDLWSSSTTCSEFVLPPCRKW